jgi:hypothetical protein
MDRNGDASINNGTELFGAATPLADGSRAGNGYAAMAQEDSNHDGTLSAADAHFNDLKLWVDANQDGKTDAGELHGLAQFGVVSLDLKGLVGNHLDHGNLLGLVSTYTTRDGATHAMADVWFAKSPSPAGEAPPRVDELLANPAAAQIPVEFATPASDLTQARAAPAQAATPTAQRGFEDSRPAPLI